MGTDEVRRHPSGIRPISYDLQKKMRQDMFYQERKKEAAEVEAQQREIAAKRAAVEAEERRLEDLQTRLLTEEEEREAIWRRDKKRWAAGQKKMASKDSDDEKIPYHHEDIRWNAHGKEAAAGEAPHVEGNPGIIKLVGQNGQEGTFLMPLALARHLRAIGHKPDVIKLTEAELEVRLKTGEKRVETKVKQGEKEAKEDQHGDRSKKKRKCREGKEDTRSKDARIAAEALMSDAIPHESKDSRSKALSKQPFEAIGAELGDMFEEPQHQSTSRSNRDESKLQTTAETAAPSQKSKPRRRHSEAPPSEKHRDKKESSVRSFFEEVGASWFGGVTPKDSKQPTPKARSKASTAKDAWDQPAASLKGCRRSTTKSASRAPTINEVLPGAWPEDKTEIRSRRSAAPSEQDDGWGSSVPPSDEAASKTSKQDTWGAPSHASEDRCTQVTRDSRRSDWHIKPNSNSSRAAASDEWPKKPPTPPEHIRSPINSKPASAGTFEEVGFGWVDPKLQSSPGSRGETLVSKPSKVSERDWAANPDMHMTTGVPKQYSFTKPTFADSRLPSVASQQYVSAAFEASQSRYSDWNVPLSEKAPFTAYGDSRRSSEKPAANEQLGRGGYRGRTSSQDSGAENSSRKTPSGRSDEVQTKQRFMVTNPDPPTPPAHFRQSTTPFAGKGWISPHPLSRASTGMESSPESKVALPAGIYPQGDTMTYSDWKEMQERGMRLHRNYSSTESSENKKSARRDERYRFAGWGNESSDSHRFDKETASGTDRTTSNYCPPTVQSEQSGDRTPTQRTSRRTSYYDEYRPKSTRRQSTSDYDEYRPESQDSRSGIRSSSQQESERSRSGTNNNSQLNSQRSRSNTNHDSRRGSERTQSGYNYRTESGTARSSRQREMEVMEEGRNVWSAVPEYEPSLRPQNAWSDMPRTHVPSERRRQERRDSSQTPTSMLYWQRYPELRE